MAAPITQAERKSQLAAATQRARLNVMRSQAAVANEQQATQEAMVAQERRQFSEQLMSGGVPAGDILRRRGRGLSSALRAQRSLGGEAALGKFEAEEDLSASDSERAQASVEEARAEQMQSAMAAAFLNANSEAQQSAQKTEAQDKLRKEVQKKAKAGFKRGIAFVINGIAAVFDMGSWATFLIDWMLYAFTFSWLNLQLFYGSYISKGKSKVISPLDWDPLPINGVVPPLILHMALIFADLVLIILGGTIVGGLAIILVMLAQAITDPINSAMGLITGTGELGAFSGMIRGIIGL